MDYRIHKRSGSKISLLGFGCMRYPLKNVDGKDVIDREKSAEMIDFAYKSGVNYYDTAYGYIEGESEIVTGLLLSKYPRESYFLADKMPTWHAKSLGDAKRIFEEQLVKTGAGYFDFYLCHAVGKMEDYLTVYKENGVYDYLNFEKQKGRIKNLGFSFHGDVALFEYMMNDKEWDFVQIQLNYLDWDLQDAKTLYRIAYEKNVQVIIMEPVRGGALATLNKEATEVFKTAAPDKSTASWAMRFAASFDNVLTVLSGMTTMEQTADNIDTLSDFKPLTQTELEIINKALAAYSKDDAIPCTGCRYCMDCPFGVDIPECFAVFNGCITKNLIPTSVGDKASRLENKKQMFKAEFSHIPQNAMPSACTACKKCEELCPQGIKISRKMAKVNGLLNL